MCNFQLAEGGAFNLCHWQFDLLMQPGLPETIWARALAPGKELNVEQCFLVSLCKDRLHGLTLG